MSVTGFFEDVVQDLRYGLRMLRRSPAVSILAIGCLTLGIGATGAVLSWIEGILLRPFPAVAAQDRLMAIAGTGSDASGGPDMSWPDFIDLQKDCTLFDSFIADKIMGTTLSVGDRAEIATGSIVSANYFDALGVHPILGRGFEASENYGRNAHPVVVISYRMWQDRFAADPNIIGRTQLFNGIRHTIVGVAPKGFYGTFVGWAMQFWVPASMLEAFQAPGTTQDDRAARWIEGFVRLKPGVTADQAQAEIAAVASRLEAQYPATNRGRGVKLFPVWKAPFNNAGTLFPTLGITLAVACFVLLIACANVCNLLLVRAFGRRQEMTIRLAIGSSRKRLFRQLITEALVLVAFSSLAGLLLANWCRNLFVLLEPARGGRTMNLPGQVDWRVLLLAAAVALGSTLLFGLVPALQSRDMDLAAALKAESGSVLATRRRSFLLSGIVLIQVSLSFVLLAGSGLLMRSLHELQGMSPGFSTEGVLTTWIDTRPAGYDVPRLKRFEDDLMDRLLSLTGVQSAVFAGSTPFSYGGYLSARIRVDGYETEPGQDLEVEYNRVGPGYLATIGIPLVSGREFSRADDETAQPVAIVNELMANQYWQGRDPLGSRLQVKGQWVQVVGIAKMSKYGSLTETAKPFFYLPMRQSIMGSQLQIRTALDPRTVAQELSEQIHSLDPDLAPGEIITMREQVERTTAPQRASAALLFVFGGVALGLAVIGLYGVMSYVVSQSSRELGLRTALGASASNLLRLVLTRGLVLTAGGIVLGGVAALLLGRVIANLLYNVSPYDPVSFGAALVVMTVASLAACLLPAIRASRTDPLLALRG